MHDEVLIKNEPIQSFWWCVSCRLAWNRGHLIFKDGFMVCPNCMSKEGLRIIDITKLICPNCGEPAAVRLIDCEMCS